MKFWYSGVFGGFGAVGRTYSAIVASVSGSMIRAVGGAASDGQTLTIRPRLSKASEPHSEAGFASEVGASEIPSGPARR